MEVATRVNAEFLPMNKTKRVVIIGKVNDKDSTPMTITTTDNKIVTVYKSGSFTDDVYSTEWVEITGRVRDDCSIEGETISSFPSSPEHPVDELAWNKLVAQIHKHPEIFK